MRLDITPAGGSSISTPVSIANGGTNSGTALNNQRVLTSVGDAIVESGAITDGESIQRNNTTFISAPLPLSVCEGRLTSASGTAVTTTNITSTTLYFTPYKGDRIYLYDGTRWKLYSFAERSLSLTATTSKNYDVFVYDNSGTITLELSAAWTNDTTRADALALQNGVYVKSGATTRRYLGTIRASATNTIEDSTSNRFVVNLYNQAFKVCESTDSSIRSFTSTSPAQVGSVQFSFLSLLGDTFVETMAHSNGFVTSLGFGIMSIGSGTTTTLNESTQCIWGNVASIYGGIICSARETPGAGVITRYLLGRSYNGTSASVDGTPYNNSSSSGGKPGTVMKALIPC